MKSQPGFTLIELLVVVAIIALLTALALPQFQRFTARARRSEGISILMGLHQSELSYYATASTYPTTSHLSGSFPPELGYELTNPAKYYIFDWALNSPYYYADSNMGGGDLGTGYTVLLVGQIDGDDQTDHLCISYPLPSCPFGNPPAQVIVMFDDLRL